jgi:hypothetical protein
MVAKGIVELIDDLFAIDRHARERHYDRAERHAWRVEHAPALLNKIKEQLEAASLGALPASKLGKATAYALGLWPRLTRFLEYPELELSTTWRRTRCDRWPLDERTGSTLAASRPGRE